jgi:hypothetical protein
MPKSSCLERARLQPRRKRHVYIVALATEGIVPRYHPLFSILYRRFITSEGSPYVTGASQSSDAVSAGFSHVHVIF